MWESWIQSLGWEDSPGEGKGYPFQYSGLENSMDSWDCKELDTTEQLSLWLFHFTLPLVDEGGSSELVSRYLLLASHLFCPVLKWWECPQRKREVPPRSDKQRKQGLLDFSHSCSHHLQSGTSCISPCSSVLSIIISLAWAFIPSAFLRGLPFLFLFFAELCSMGDLTYPTRDWTHTLALEHGVLTTVHQGTLRGPLYRPPVYLLLFL